MKILKISFLILFLTALLIPTTTIQAQSADQLRLEIEERNEELKRLQEEREALERELSQAESFSSELQDQINNINNRINQLEVSIRTNEVAIERLELETQSLNSNIQTTEENIGEKKKAIGRLLVELQQKDNEGLLTTILKNNTLSESVSEIESILALGNNLTENINDLRNLQQQLSTQVEQVEENKRQREIEQGALVNRQSIILEEQEEKERLLALTENEKREYEQQINEIDQKQEEISNVIEEIEHQLRAAFDPDVLPLERPGVISFPVQNIFTTQCYGRTEFAAQAYRTNTHIGMDFRAPVGTPILAVDSGQVVAVDNNDVSQWQRYQFGKYVIIEHENNLSSLYSHLSSFKVSVGERIERGDVLGYSGNTGYSTGPHLHLGIYATPPGGWRQVNSRESAGLLSIPPAAGLVPVGIHVDPAPYLPNNSEVSKCL